MVDFGGAPILYEDVRGVLSIPSQAKTCHVWGLDTNGTRLKEIAVTPIAEGFAMSLGGYAHYEIILE